MSAPFLCVVVVQTADRGRAGKRIKGRKNLGIP